MIFRTLYVLILVNCNKTDLGTLNLKQVEGEVFDSKSGSPNTTPSLFSDNSNESEFISMAVEINLNRTSYLFFTCKLMKLSAKINNFIDKHPEKIDSCRILKSFQLRIKKIIAVLSKMKRKFERLDLSSYERRTTYYFLNSAISNIYRRAKIIYRKKIRQSNKE